MYIDFPYVLNKFTTHFQLIFIYFKILKACEYILCWRRFLRKIKFNCTINGVKNLMI